jgi:hypothetical protein
LYYELKRKDAIMETKEPLSKEVRERINYTCFMIVYFAEAYKMDKPEGYQYLKKYGGLDFIREHWWALHTENQYYAARYVFDVCKNNGGYMR